MMRHLAAILLTALAALALWAGCSAIGCTENQNSLPLAGFYSSSTDAAITVDSLLIGGIDAPDDSLLVGIDEKVSQLYLPLRSNSQETGFYIRYMQAALAAYDLEDVIIFRYTSTPYFASEDCGAMYRYRITSVEYSRNIIDSVAVTVPDSTITNVEQEYLRIYLRTASPDTPSETPLTP